jgi:hypothetical protein
MDQPAAVWLKRRLREVDGSSGRRARMVLASAYTPCSSVMRSGCEQPLSPSTAIATAQLGSVSIVSVRLLSDSQAEAQGLKAQLLLLARGLAGEVTTLMKPCEGCSAVTLV